jgi:hypothetical protein
MAEKAADDTGMGSPAAVALQLMKMIAHCEGKVLAGAIGRKAPTKKYILKTYAECYRAATGYAWKD